MSGEVNVLSRTQLIKVEPTTKSVSVINAGPQGPGGGGGGGGSNDAVDINVADAALNFVGTNVEDVLAELHDLIEAGGDPDLAALEARVAKLEAIGRFNMDSVAGVVGDGSTDCTAAIQSIIDFFGLYTDPITGAHGVPVRLVFPQPEGYRYTHLDIPYDNIFLEGIGKRRGGLICTNPTGAAKSIHWHGTDSGDYSGRIEGGGTVNLRLSNAGTSNTTSIFCENTTAMIFIDTAWWAFRGAGSLIMGRNCADQYIWEPEADFCGNITPERALFDLGENPGGEWACDRWRIWGGRLENNSGPVVNAISAGHFVTKFFMNGTKIENQTTDGNGTGGSIFTGTLFRFDHCLNIDLIDLDLTLGGLSSLMLGNPLPCIMDFDTCFGVKATGSINLGLPGVKPFLSYIKTTGGTGYTFGFRLSANQVDGSCLPDQVFSWYDEPREVDTSGTYWAYNANSLNDGGSGPNLTSDYDLGTIGSSQIGYDTKFNTLYDALLTHIGDPVHGGLSGARVFEQDIGDNTLKTFTVVHGFETAWPEVKVYEKATGYPVRVDVLAGTPGQVDVGSFAVAPTTNQYRVVIVG